MCSLLVMHVVVAESSRAAELRSGDGKDKMPQVVMQDERDTGA